MNQMNPEELEGVARRYVDVRNRHNPTALDTVIAANAVRHDPATGTSEGIESIRETMKTLLTAFPDLLISIDQVLADEDCVVLRWAGSGTHRGDFLGAPPSGNTFSVKGIASINALKGG
jgi:steroid delta-isomerase-like uncharacterized protein